MKRKIPKGYQKGGAASTNHKPITKNRKKHVRSIRKEVGNVLPDGKTETHRMATYTGENKKATYAAPTIAFDKDGNKKPQSFQQALEEGEVYEFKSKKRADKFAFGSWKKGKEKRKAMKSYRKKMQTGGAPPTLQSRLENSWRAELGEIDDLVTSGLGDMSPQAQAKMMERQGSLRGQLGLNKYGQPENKNTYIEGKKSKDWTFTSGMNPEAQSGTQTFTYDPNKEKRKTDRAYKKANRANPNFSTIDTGEGEYLNPELEGGGFNKESMTDPDSGLSKGLGIGANLAGTYFDKLAGEDYAAREKKRDEAVANVDRVTGQSDLYHRNKEAMAWKKGQTDLVEGYDYAGHGAKSGAVKGASAGAQVGGPMGALVGGALGAIGGGLMGKSQGEDAKFALAADTAKKRKALQGMQSDEVSLIDPTKDEYASVAAITVKKGGKIKKQAGGLIKGPGTGTSDDIPGNLNEGDFVATAKNKNKALALRKQFGLPMQKANLQKGGKTMKKIPVKVSNGETLFTKNEINSMVKKGGGKVIDYLNSLAPEAEVPLQNGGVPKKRFQGNYTDDIRPNYPPEYEEKKDVLTGKNFMNKTTRWRSPEERSSANMFATKIMGEFGTLEDTDNPKDIGYHLWNNQTENTWEQDVPRLQNLIKNHSYYSLPGGSEDLKSIFDDIDKSNQWSEYVDIEERWFKENAKKELLDKLYKGKIEQLRKSPPPHDKAARARRIKKQAAGLQKGGTVKGELTEKEARTLLQKDPSELTEKELENVTKWLSYDVLKREAKEPFWGTAFVGIVDEQRIRNLKAELNKKRSLRIVSEAKPKIEKAIKDIDNKINNIQPGPGSERDLRKLGDDREKLDDIIDKLEGYGKTGISSVDRDVDVESIKEVVNSADKLIKTNKYTTTKPVPVKVDTDLQAMGLALGSSKKLDQKIKEQQKIADVKSASAKVASAKVAGTGATITTTPAKTTTPAVTTTKKPKELEVGLYTDEEGNVFEKGRTGKWRWKSNKAIEEGTPEYGELPIDLDEEWQEGDIEVDESVLTPYTPPLPVEEEGEEDPGPDPKEPVEAEREFPWSDVAGALQAGMGYKGLASMGQRPKGVESPHLAAQKARIDAAQSEFNIPIDETLRDIESVRRASIIPTTGERGYEFAKRSAATGQAMSNIQKTREQKAILEGQAADRFGLAKLGMQGQMASALAGEDRMLFQDDMDAFQQKQGAYAQLLQAGIGNFLKGKEARATRRSMKDIEGDVTINLGG